MAKELGGDSARDGLVRTPAGNQNFQGMPFRLGPEGSGEEVLGGCSARAQILARHPSWRYRCSGKAHLHLPRLLLRLGRERNSAAQRGCHRKSRPATRRRRAGLRGRQRTRLPHPAPIRSERAFVSPGGIWLTPAAPPPGCTAQADRRVERRHRWGELQTVVWDNAYAGGPLGTLWVCALANPQPERELKAVRLKAASDDLAGDLRSHALITAMRILCAMNACALYRFTLPEAGRRPQAMEAGSGLGGRGANLRAQRFRAGGLALGARQGFGRAQPSLRKAHGTFTPK